MERKLSIFIADANEDFRLLLGLAAEGDERMELSGSTSDGKEALAMIAERKPDVLVLDLMLTRLDGLSLLRRLSEMEVSPRIIAVSSFYSESIVAECTSVGVDYFITKPCDVSAVLDRAFYLVTTPREALGNGGIEIPIKPQNRLEVLVTDILREIGIPPHMKGYTYAREAIIIAVNDMNMIHTVTKGLYPAVAMKYDTTSLCVEKAIRSGIEAAQKRGNADAMQKYFGNKAARTKNRPTNAEFIAAIADQLRLLSKLGG